MESILCVDIPVQMISCTDTNGKITPMRFRFRDKTGELVTITIDKILARDQDRNRVGRIFPAAPAFTAGRKHSGSDTAIFPTNGVCPAWEIKTDHKAQ